MKVMAPASEGETRSEPGQEGMRLELPAQVFDVLVDRAASLAAARLSPERDYLTTAEVASYLSWPRKRIDNLCSAGAIPYRKVGGRRAFIRQEIDAWIDAQPGITVGGALLAL
jgi:excisionase family DNA binding protein